MTKRYQGAHRSGPRPFPSAARLPLPADPWADCPLWPEWDSMRRPLYAPTEMLPVIQVRKGVVVSKTDK
jgi:hypothetical protein